MQNEDIHSIECSRQCCTLRLLSEVPEENVSSRADRPCISSGKFTTLRNECLEAAKLSELHFKRLLLRLIALQLFENETYRSKIDGSMKRLRLSKAERQVLRMVADGHGVCPDAFPRRSFDVAVWSLECAGLVRAARE